jgi:hypothetical protein
MTCRTGDRSCGVFFRIVAGCVGDPGARNALLKDAVGA